MATELFPIIVTADLQRSLRFYRDLLGGRVTYEFAGPDGKAAYVGLEIGTSHIGIGADPNAGRTTGRRIDLWVYSGDPDLTVERLRGAGVRVLQAPRDEPWGERVAKVEDPDGTHVYVAGKATRS